MLTFIFLHPLFSEVSNMLHARNSRVRVYNFIHINKCFQDWGRLYELILRNIPLSVHLRGKEQKNIYNFNY